jgi:hypothetical protein
VFAGDQPCENGVDDPSLIMEAETVSETFDHDEILTRMIVRDFTSSVSMITPFLVIQNRIFLEKL